MKLLNKQLHPDAPEGGGTPTPAKTASTSAQPSKDDDLGAVAQTVAEKWAVTPAITLIWITSAEFTTLKDNYKSALSTRQATGSTRPTITVELKTILKTIKKGASKVKQYVDKIATSDAQARAKYSQFGFVHKNNSYNLPTDRTELKAALELMIPAIAANGFGTEEYGTTFWTDIQTQFITAATAATDTDGNVSGTASTKNQLKKQLKKVLVALRLIIQGNYPETYKSELRLWGWQKEDF